MPLHRLSVSLCAFAACFVIGMQLVTLAASAKEYSHLHNIPFSVIKSSPAQRLTVFYFESSPSPVLEVVNEAAKLVLDLDFAKLRHLQFVKIDCDSKENRADCDEAGFKLDAGKEWVFTSTPHDGIQSFSGTRDVATIANHVRHKFLDYDEKDVLQFSDENALFHRLDSSPRDPPKPIFVKFYEQWCTHCKNLKLTFMQAATFFRDQVEFMEVECSNSAESKAFCDANTVSSFPALILFDGEHKTKYDEPEKSIVNFQRFFLQTLTEEQYQHVEDKEGEMIAKAVERRGTSIGTASKKTKKEAAETTKTKAGKKQKDSRTGDEDEEAAPKSQTSKKQPKRQNRYEEDDDSLDEPQPNKKSSNKKSKKKKKKSRYEEDDDADDEVRPKKKTKKSKSRGDDRPLHDEL